MEMLAGEYSVILDETGRICLPFHLRGDLGETDLFLTKGIENCLRLFSSGEWDKIINDITKNADPLSEEYCNFKQCVIDPAQKVKIDRMGRIFITQSLREYAALTKNCVILGQFEYIEIWAEDRYREYLEASREEFAAELLRLRPVIDTARQVNVNKRK